VAELEELESWRTRGAGWRSWCRRAEGGVSGTGLRVPAHRHSRTQPVAGSWELGLSDRT
jgi:hypothetical protein